MYKMYIDDSLFIVDISSCNITSHAKQVEARIFVGSEMG